MAAALARPLTAVPPTAGAGADLRVARPVDEVDLDAAWVDATAPHRVAAARDARPDNVVSLDAARARRTATARVRRHRVAGVLFALGLALVLALGAGALVADADGPAPVGQTVTVQPGQTLWDVAVDATAEGQDPRVTLDRIRDLNGLDGTDVPAWTPVVLPAG